MRRSPLGLRALGLVIGLGLLPAAEVSAERPFLPPPPDQPRKASARRETHPRSDMRGKRRVQLTAVPTYASFPACCPLGFIGRPERKPIRGGGFGLELDIALPWLLWLRIHGSYTAHLVQQELRLEQNGQTTLLANAGSLQVGQLGAALVVAIDWARLFPWFEFGLGALWMQPPAGATTGQLGQACGQGGLCDAGLVCAADNLCRVSTLPEAHAALGLDVALGRRFSLGAGVRYFALLRQVSTYPVYLQAGLRLGLRF